MATKQEVERLAVKELKEDTKAHNIRVEESKNMSSEGQQVGRGR